MQQVITRTTPKIKSANPFDLVDPYDPFRVGRREPVDVLQSLAMPQADHDIVPGRLPTLMTAHHKVSES